MPKPAWVNLRERLVALRFLSFLEMTTWASSSSSEVVVSSALTEFVDAADSS